jgi:hypothetical protein
MIKDTIIKSYHKIQQTGIETKPQDSLTTQDGRHNICHPMNPKSHERQHIFQNKVVSPRGCIQQLHKLKNHKNRRISINKMIVA